MVTVTPRTVVTMRLNATCPSHARTDVTVRDLRSTIDEPVERGARTRGSRRPKRSWRRCSPART